MDTDLIAIGIAYACGLVARQVGLPPLIGYLLAGFGLYAAGIRLTPTLQAFSALGVSLLLFTIGLKLRPSSLLMPQIWACLPCTWRSLRRRSRCRSVALLSQVWPSWPGSMPGRCF